MLFKCILLGICFIVILFIFWPKLKLKYKLYKELKIKKKRQKAFKNKMKELEIK